MYCTELAGRLLLRPGAQVAGAARGVSLQRGDPARPHQVRPPAARQPPLLRQLRQHHRQQDHGGHHDDRQAVRGRQGRVRRLPNRP